MDLNDSKALVTGASRGIGRAIALELASHGADVVVNYCSSEKKASEVVEEIQGMDRIAFSVKADVSDSDSVKNMVEYIVEELGEIDILINNAGILHRVPFEEVKIEDWDRVMHVNLRGAFLCCRYVGPYMIEKKRGNIVNISSIAALNPEIYLGAYSISKAGLNMLTQLLAVEWGKYNIRVNAVCPGPIQTPMIKQAFDSDRLFEARIQGIPIKRMGRTEEVARIVAFLVSDESSYITGENIVIDGGSSRSMYHLVDKIAEIIREDFSH